MEFNSVFNNKKNIHVIDARIQFNLILRHFLYEYLFQRLFVKGKWSLIVFSIIKKTFM